MAIQLIAVATSYGSAAPPEPEANATVSSLNAKRAQNEYTSTTNTTTPNRTPSKNILIRDMEEFVAISRVTRLVQEQAIGMDCERFTYVAYALRDSKFVPSEPPRLCSSYLEKLGRYRVEDMEICDKIESWDRVFKVSFAAGAATFAYKCATFVDEFEKLGMELDKYQSLHARRRHLHTANNGRGIPQRR